MKAIWLSIGIILLIGTIGGLIGLLVDIIQDKISVKRTGKTKFENMIDSMRNEE